MKVAISPFFIEDSLPKPPSTYCQFVSGVCHCSSKTLLAWQDGPLLDSGRKRVFFFFYHGCVDITIPAEHTTSNFLAKANKWAMALCHKITLTKFQDRKKEKIKMTHRKYKTENEVYQDRNI